MFQGPNIFFQVLRVVSGTVLEVLIKYASSALTLEIKIEFKDY